MDASHRKDSAEPLKSTLWEEQDKKGCTDPAASLVQCHTCVILGDVKEVSMSASACSLPMHQRM